MWKSSLLPVRASELNPAFDIDGQRMVMDTAALAAVPISVLRNAAHNLSSQQLPIQNALDILFGAY
jgi:toxin CcdB